MYGCVVNGRWRMWVVVLDRPLRVRRSGRTFRSYDACGSSIYVALTLQRYHVPWRSYGSTAYGNRGQGGPLRFWNMSSTKYLR